MINIALLMLGFGIGQLSVRESPPQVVRPIQRLREISVVAVQEIVGDELKINISGPVRLVLNESMVEGEGEHLLPLSQIATEEDLKFETFPYTGNSKTLKFYPSSTHVARGTHHAHRRFFDSKQAAIDAGFIASKLVK